MSKEFPVPLEQLGLTEKPQGQIPDDFDTRANLQRQRLPELAKLGTVVDDVPAPDVSIAASAVSGVETFDMSAFPDLKILVNTYLGENPSSGAPGTLKSGLGPATALTGATNDRVSINVAGDGAQDADIGNAADGDAVAAGLQAAVRGLTAVDDRNQEAYDSFTCEYTAPTFATTLFAALVTGVEVNKITLTSVAGLRTGKTLRLVGPTTVTELTVIDIQRTSGGGKIVQTQKFTPSENIPVGSVVKSKDDYYRLTTGKRGADMSIVVANAGANNGADILLLRDGDGIERVIGRDRRGNHTIKFEAADFASPAAATAEEVLAVINKTLTGAQANLTGAGTTVTLVTDRLGADASLLVSGAAQSVLGFPATEVVGTEDEVALSLDGPDVLHIQPYVAATGVLLALLDDPVNQSLVRQRRDNLVNFAATDFSNGGVNRWKVYSRPGGRLEEV